MKQRKSTLLASLAMTAMFAASVAAQRDNILVSSSWLAQHAKDANLVVLHVGARRDFEAGHIPGARFVATESLFVSEPLTLEMQPADKLRESLAGLGISNDSRIVVYYDTNRVAPATRVVFTLDYAGLGAQTSLLDGGLIAWKRGGNPVTTEATPAKTGTLSALKIKPIVVTAEGVQSRLGRAGVSVVDGRTTAFYDGAQTGGGRGAPHKTGHIAGAKSVPYTDITDTDWLLKPADQLAALFAKAGVAKGDTVVGYCHIGQQATAMLFAARSLGYPVLLYDGSFEDWSRRDLPVEKKP
jgi:thiosulfate/3-mercaptopyruvate sulfurtransferase